MLDAVEELKRIGSMDAAMARALPATCYSDTGLYAAELDRIFHGDWVFVCNTHQVKAAGDRYALLLAGEPVVVIRGDDGKLRALSNVCAHRGTPIADDGESTGNGLICPYHSWNYALDGRLKGAPITGRVNVDKASHCLPEFQLEEWCGLVFVNVDGDAEPLAAQLAGIDPYLQLFNQVQSTHGVEYERQVWRANWKLVLENAMESYHLFKVHPSTLETISPTRKAFYIQGENRWTLTGGEYADNSGPVMKWLAGKPSGPERHYLLLMLPPNFVGILSADGVNAYVSVMPDGAGRSIVRSGATGPMALSQSRANANMTENFLAEDKWICERAQTGMESQYFRGGQLVELERVVHDFHRYLAHRFTGSSASEGYCDPLAWQRLTAP